jgi:MFS family permease
MPSCREYEHYARILSPRRTGTQNPHLRRIVAEDAGDTFGPRRDLALYLGAGLCAEAATQALSVAAGWSLYEASHDPLALGLAGLAQLVPVLLITLPAGELADRRSPRQVTALGLALQALCACGLLALAISRGHALWPFYPLLALLGGARALTEPASQALLPQLVPAMRLPRAIAWSSSVWQLAAIAGPALGGLAYASGSTVAYTLCAAGFLGAMLGILALPGRPAAPATGATLRERITRIAEGVGFVRSSPIVLGAISLDMFAVLLGGATALLPVYARDILHVGPAGLGLLQCAPAAGASLSGIIQARHPPQRRIGLLLFCAVAVFALATVVFACSASFTLSVAMLACLGAADMISVNIRAALIQLGTPEALRGRVSAVNMLFIGAASQLGAFESGLTAALLGTVPAVALGGAGTLLLAAIWMRQFPGLRMADRPLPVSR